MEKKDNLISNTRLFSQKIAATEFKTAKEIVSWMGAVQAQDYSMAKWAVGLRLSDSIDEMVESSFNKGEILRIHVLRPTWHFVSPDDIYWIINLTAPKILSSLKSRHKQLELSESVIIKSTTLIENEPGKGISFYPITFPITTVAGTFAVLFTLSAPGNANNISQYLINTGDLLVSIIIFCILIFVFFVNANRFIKYVGSHNEKIINRLMAFLIFCV